MVQTLSKLEHMKSSLFELRCNWRMLKHVTRFRDKSPWSASRLLDERVATGPEDLAVAYLDQRYTWREVDERVNQYAHFFAHRGIGPRDVVALLMDNRPDCLFCVLGLNRLGAVASLVNTNLVGVALVHAIEVCQPKAVLVGVEHEAQLLDVLSSLEPLRLPVWMHVDDERVAFTNRLERVDRHVAMQPTFRSVATATPNSSDVMCFIYTSGTTGLPKAAIITNKRWLAAAYMFGGAMMDAGPGDVIYAALPLYHSSGMYAGLGGALASGAALALRRKFSASAFWTDVRAFDATIFLYIGELCRYLLNTPSHPDERSHRLRLGVGNGLRPDVWGPFQDRFGVPLMREFYGATEGNAPIVNFEGRRGMVGRLKPNQVIVACDPATGELRRDARGFCERVPVGGRGLLLARITSLFGFDGYLDRSASQKKIVEGVFKRGDRYFNSGDVLQLHEGGWVSFVDRVGDTFRWKGENVSTNEVAEILNRFDGVLESNVYGVVVPGAEGRAGMAALTVGCDLDMDALARFVCASMPSYQRPHFVRLLRDMRVTGTFKHQKVDYRDEGFDPARVSDPLYVLDGERYLPIDGPMHARILAAEVGPAERRKAEQAPQAVA